MSKSHVLLNVFLIGILLLSVGFVNSSFERVLLIHTLSESLNAVLFQANFAVSQIPPVEYDVQLGITFTQDFTVLAYNVTALAQSDAYEYGPAYLLNGVSNLGYWYQVGVVYNWPYRTRGGYTPGLNFVCEVFDPRGRSVFPIGGARLLSFSNPVSSGDLVLLTMYFSGGNVVMFAKNWRTGGIASSAYSAMGATYFMGFPSAIQSRSQVFTGLMTEWYHVNPLSGSEQKVTYSNYGSALSSAWMWIDEWDPSNPSWSGAWFDITPSPVKYSSNPNQFQLFTFHNFTVASNAYEFITGYSGETNPVTGYYLSPIMEVEIAIAMIIILVDLYVIVRRRHSYREPESINYTRSTSEMILSHPNFCPSCGAKLSAEEKFCRNCGRPLS